MKTSMIAMVASMSAALAFSAAAEGPQSAENTARMDTAQAQTNTRTNTQSGTQTNIRAIPENTWVGLSGTVESIDGNDFVLNTGSHQLEVETTDRIDWYELFARDAVERLEPGDQVTVYGELQDAAYESRTLDADAIYVPKSQTYYFSDDENRWTWGSPPVYREGDDWLRLTGTVTSKSEDELRLESGRRDVRVDVSHLEEGALSRIEEGSRVIVFGPGDTDVLSGEPIAADSVMLLSQLQPSEAASARRP